MAKAKDLNALKAKGWSLVEAAEKLVLEAETFEQRRGSLHAAKQVYEFFGALLDKHDRALDVEELRARLDRLQATVAPKLGKLSSGRTTIMKDNHA